MSCQSPFFSLNFTLISLEPLLLHTFQWVVVLIEVWDGNGMGDRSEKQKQQQPDPDVMMMFVSLSAVCLSGKKRRGLKIEFREMTIVSSCDLITTCLSSLLMLAVCFSVCDSRICSLFEAGTRQDVGQRFVWVESYVETV